MTQHYLRGLKLAQLIDKAFLSSVFNYHALMTKLLIVHALMKAALRRRITLFWLHDFMHKYDKVILLHLS